MWSQQNAVCQSCSYKSDRSKSLLWKRRPWISVIDQRKIARLSLKNLLNWQKRLFASIRLRLFDGDRLVCGLHFDSVKIEIEIGYLPKFVCVILRLQFDVDEPLCVHQVARTELVYFGRLIELNRVYMNLN